MSPHPQGLSTVLSPDTTMRSPATSEPSSIQRWPNSSLGGSSGKAPSWTARLGGSDSHSTAPSSLRTVAGAMGSHHLSHSSPWFPAAHQN